MVSETAGNVVHFWFQTKAYSGKTSGSVFNLVLENLASSARYEVRSEYRLANPELFQAVPKDEPDALLEAVAMAGLVGIVRQLGDLAELAAEIFHDLHEEAKTVSCRSLNLQSRVQKVEVKLPALERCLLAKSNQLRFVLSKGKGATWHAKIDIPHNHFSQGDLPSFIEKLYEECREPPMLSLLDKFDAAGPGACFKRYSDPSFIRTQWADLELLKAKRDQRDKRVRLEKKKGKWPKHVNVQELSITRISNPLFCGNGDDPEKQSQHKVKRRFPSLSPVSKNTKKLLLEKRKTSLPTKAILGTKNSIELYDNETLRISAADIEARNMLGEYLISRNLRDKSNLLLEPLPRMDKCNGILNPVDLKMKLNSLISNGYRKDNDLENHTTPKNQLIKYSGVVKDQVSNLPRDDSKPDSASCPSALVLVEPASESIKHANSDSPPARIIKECGAIECSGEINCEPISSPTSVIQTEIIDDSTSGSLLERSHSVTEFPKLPDSTMNQNGDILIDFSRSFSPSSESLRSFEIATNSPFAEIELQSGSSGPGSPDLSPPSPVFSLLHSPMSSMQHGIEVSPELRTSFFNMHLSPGSPTLGKFSPLCTLQEMPPPPPMPPLKWRAECAKTSHVTVPIPPPMVTSGKSINVSKGVPSSKLPLQEKNVNRGRDMLMQAISAHDKAKLKNVTSHIQHVTTKPLDTREALLEQIRSKSFSLKRTPIVKHGTPPRPKTNINVAAILEKANAIRQACNGSEEEGADWAD